MKNSDQCAHVTAQRKEVAFCAKNRFAPKFNQLIYKY